MLPAEAAGIQGEWLTVRQICRVIRSRQVKKNAEWQKPQHEVVYLVSSLIAAASPQALLGVNRDHWRIEIMHRNKDVILGEDGYANRCDNAPRNIFSLTGFVLKILKSVAPSPTRAIEHFQDDRNRAMRLFSGFYLNHIGIGISVPQTAAEALREALRRSQPISVSSAQESRPRTLRSGSGNSTRGSRRHRRNVIAHMS